MVETSNPDKPPRVLWWGRSDHDYSRNSIIRQCFQQQGWEVHDFRPWLSSPGDLQAHLSRAPSADLIWVPCFRQRDIAAASRYAAAAGIPLCIDPLISAYDKQVDEREKFAADSASARRLRRWESRLFQSAQCVVADTQDHANYFVSQLGVDAQRICVIPVGADETMFEPCPVAEFDGQLKVLFYGSFLALQGPQFIVQAAECLQARNVSISLLGEGPLHAQCKELARDAANIHFEPWIAYQQLPARIAQAHVLLGVFGSSGKASRVIPNKVYQALACARPVITRDSHAYPEPLRETRDGALRFVQAGDPQALANAIDMFAFEPQQLPQHARAAADIYRQWFSHSRVSEALFNLLQGLGLPASAKNWNF